MTSPAPIMLGEHEELPEGLPDGTFWPSCPGSPS